MTTVNLEDVITDAVSDSELPTEVEETTDTTTETTPEAAPETPESTTEEVVEETPTNVVKSPAAKAATQEPDEFEKKFGIPAQSVNGRENRIPHSRVQKIVAKAERDITASFTPKLTEYEGKVKDYETRLGRVAEFEKVMMNEPEKFVGMLKTIPLYQEYFSKMVTPAAPQQEVKPTTPVDDMPQPDTELTDGSRVYSLEGLKALQAWTRQQAKSEVMKEVEERFKPIEDERQARQREVAAQQHLQTVVLPKIQAEIDEAKKWPQFTENEDEIVKILQSNPNVSLEGAYRMVVFPKFQATREQMRAEVLKELKKAPTSTSTPASGLKPVTQSAGPRDLEAIIREQVAQLK